MQFAPRFRLALLVSRTTSISRAPPPRCAGDTHPKVGPSAMRPSPATARAAARGVDDGRSGRVAGASMIILDRPRPTTFALHHISPPFVRIPWRTASPGGALRALCASPCRGARGAGRQKCGEFAADFTYKVVGMDDVDPLNPPPPARNHPPRPSARRPRTRLRWGKWSVRDDSVPNRIL